MELDGSIQFVILLLPGFITAAVVNLLATGRKAETLERVIEALIYTFLCHVCWEAYSAWHGPATSPDGPDEGNARHFLGLTVIALLLGLVVSTLRRIDALGVFRTLGLTNNTTRPSVWYSAFFDHISYCVVHLSDGRRIYGWIREYEHVPGEGHLLLKNARWLSDEKQSSILTNRTDILIKAALIDVVEFVPEES